MSVQRLFGLFTATFRLAQNCQEQLVVDSTLTKCLFCGIFGFMTEFSWKPITGRGYDEYLEWLNITDADLNGKLLDLGAGLGRFTREAATRGVDIVALEPELFREDIRECYTGDSDSLPTATTRAVAGEAQALPFRDGSFDTVTSLFAVPLEVGRANYVKTYREIYRVLRPGGRAYLTPLNATELAFSTSHLDELEISYSLKTVETPFGPIDDWKRLTIEKPED